MDQTINVTITGARFGTAPLRDGGREIVVHHEPSATKYRLPLSAEGVEQLVKELTMPEAELRSLIEGQQSG